MRGGGGGGGGGLVVMGWGGGAKGGGPGAFEMKALKNSSSFQTSFNGTVGGLQSVLL